MHTNDIHTTHEIWSGFNKNIRKSLLFSLAYMKLEQKPQHKKKFNCFFFFKSNQGMRNTSNLQNFKFGWWNKNKNQIETQIVCCWKSKMTQNTTTALQIQTTEENYSKIFFPQDFFFLQTNYICLFMCTVCVPITLKCALKLGLSFELGRVYMNWNEIHQNKIIKVFVVVRVWECVFVWMFFFCLWFSNIFSYSAHQLNIGSGSTKWCEFLILIWSTGMNKQKLRVLFEIDEVDDFDTLN